MTVGPQLPKPEPTYLSNGKKIFKCRFCDFTSPASASVVAHERRCVWLRCLPVVVPWLQHALCT